MPDTTRSMQLPILFPLCAKIFGYEGIRITEAQRRQEQNKNANTPLEVKLEVSNAQLYDTNYINLGNNSKFTVEIEKLGLADFTATDSIARRKGQSAWYGHAINYYKSIREELESMNIDVLMTKYGHKKPVNPVPFPDSRSIIKKSAITTTPTKFRMFKKVQQLLQNVNAEVLEQFQPEEVRAMLDTESKASVYGKLIHTDSFLYRVANSKRKIDRGQTKTDGMIVLMLKELAYSDEELIELNDLRKRMQEEHKKWQTKRNGYVAKIRKTVDAIQRQYDEEYLAAETEQSNIEKDYRSELKLYNVKGERLRTALLAELSEYKVLDLAQ